MLNANLLETVHHGIDKVEHYKWKIKDKKGALTYISKSMLQIDHQSYQRDNVTKDKVISMARAWSWVACGAIHVAKRPDDTYWVIDGQYRLLAALRRSDIQDLPCIVFEAHEIKEEAEGFLNVNTNRKAMQRIDRFKAELTAEHEEAIFVAELVTSIGWTIAPTGGNRTVRCVGSLVQWARRGHQYKEMLKRMLPVLDKLVTEGPMPVNLLDGVMYLEASMQEGHSLGDKKVRARLAEIGQNELLDACSRARAFRGKGGSKTYADGISQRYNKGLTHKLPVRDGALTF